MPTPDLQPRFLAAQDRNTPRRLAEFTHAAQLKGFSTNEAARMYLAIAGLRLSYAAATTWMEAGFTPWAVPAWQDRGVLPREAADRRARGDVPGLPTLAQDRDETAP